MRANSTRARSEGDWDDIDAAVLDGTYKLEWVVGAWWWADDNTRIYELRNARGVSGTLRAHRTSMDPAARIEFIASIGPFGDAAAEKTLIAKIEDRLAALHGVDAVPVK